MQGKTVIVTGANVGIGLETARGLAKLGANVVMTARDRAKGEAALADVRASVPGSKVELQMLDLASLEAVRAAAKEMLEKHPRIDVLVNNAGLVLDQRRESKDGFEMTFATNHLGPFLLTNLLLDRLKASAPSRIVNVASEAHKRGGQIDFDDLHAKRSYWSFSVYGRSKLANIHFTTELARRLAGTRVTAYSLHPGVVATGFAADGDAAGILRWVVKLARPFMITPEKGARTSIHCASSPDLEGVSGRYYDRCREKEPAATAKDAAVAKRLWEESAKLVGLPSTI